jgi:hypothetical protein
MHRIDPKLGIRFWAGRSRARTKDSPPRSRLSTLVLLLATVAGVAGAIAVMRTTPEAANTGPPSPREIDNQIVLSHRESLRLVSWARALRGCLAQNGVDVGRPAAHAKQIDLPLRSKRNAAELAPTVTACGDRLQRPPLASSLQIRPGKLVLYLPKQCLLDPKVRARAA